MTAIGVNKSKAVSMLSRYYKIDLENIISIGDSYNDIGMFEISTISVAMANSPLQVKKNATVILKKQIKKRGVGDYINRFLKNPTKEIEKSKKVKMKLSTAPIEATEY